MSMKLINSKSILDCDEREEEIHNQGNNQFAEKLFDSLDYECATFFKKLTRMMSIQKLLLTM